MHSTTAISVRVAEVVTGWIQHWGETHSRAHRPGGHVMPSAQPRWMSLRTTAPLIGGARDTVLDVKIHVG